MSALVPSDPKPSSEARWPLRLALLLWAAALAWHGLRPLADLDLWWNLRLGEQIVQTGSLVGTDPFSYTALGTPWPWKDWGTALVLYAAWTLGGSTGVISFKAGCLAAVAIGTWRWVRHERNVPAALALVTSALAVDAASFRITERGASLSLAITMAILVVVERHRRGRRGLWWAVPLVVLNANVHRGVLFAAVLLAALAIVEAAEHFVLKQPRPWRRSAAVALASTAACFATPFGWQLVATTIELMGSHTPLLTEWAPVEPRLVWRLTPSTYAAAAMVVGGGAAQAWRSRNLWDGVLVALALGLGLQSLRHLPYLALVGVGPAASGLARIPDAWTGRLRHVIALGAAALALVGQIARPLPGPVLGLAPAHFPEKGVAFIESLPDDLRLRGPMFNEFGYGGFLIFHLWPEYRVYIDGRTDLVYPVEAVERYIRALGDPTAFAQEQAKWGLQWVIIDNAPPVGSLAHLDRNPQWVLVHASRRALVYVKADGPNRALAEQRGYRYLWPHALLPSLVAADQAGHGQQALQELRRMVLEDPDNLYAAAALAEVQAAQARARAR